MFSLNCKGHIQTFTRPVVMGIVNTTPDSFFSESRKQQKDDVLFKVDQMLNDGASMIDIGGQSTRPGSVRITVEEELKRVLPAVDAIIKRFPDTFLSIDTFYAKVAQYAVEAGASLVNDISAGSIDPELLPIVAKLKVPYVLMHMQGDPQTMQSHSQYQNVVTDVFDFFSFRLQKLYDGHL
jgi:dihydropteroate synthase